MPAKSKAEWIRRFLKKEKPKAYDWLAHQMIYLNTESTIITRTEALKMDIKEFFFIIRARKKHNQAVVEKMGER